MLPAARSLAIALRSAHHDQHRTALTTRKITPARCWSGTAETFITATVLVPSFSTTARGKSPARTSSKTE
ncbi:hypothetical protein pipiens_002915 [Culex pipiens pipiens]|uniref:Uncharacterized protein n=1 Tax=Culex pipiens pipiens TaxID=38569 RepID=A0ABD1D668_CULPP